MRSRLVFGSASEECLNVGSPVDSKRERAIKRIASWIGGVISAVFVVYLGVALSTGLEIQVFPNPDTPLLVKLKNADIVAIDSETFPDEAFRIYLRDVFDVDNSGGFSEQEIETVSVMNIRDLNIRDLTGLELFPQLMDLNCVDNPIEFIPLSDIAKIKRIDARNCPLRSLSLPRTTKMTIEELYIGMTEPNSWSSPVFFYDPLSKMVAYAQRYGVEEFQIDHPSFVMLFTDLPGIPERGIPKIENGSYTSTYVHIEDIGDFSGYDSLKKLGCVGLSVSRITNCPSLMYIDMRVSTATTVYILGCQSLQTVKADQFVEFNDLDESLIERWDRWIPSTTPGNIIDPESQEYMFVLPYVERAYQEHASKTM